MPRAPKPYVEARPTRDGAWLRLTDAVDVQSALKIGDLVAADLDATGTWPRWYEVRVVQSQKTIEHWSVRDKGPMLVPANEAGYILSLYERSKGYTGNLTPGTARPEPRTPARASRPRRAPDTSAPVVDGTPAVPLERTS